MIRRARWRRKGFTMIEVLIASVAAVFVTGGVTALLIMYAKTAQGALFQSTLDHRGRRTMRELQTGIRRATDIVVKDSSGTEVEGAPGVRLELTFAGGGTAVFELSNGDLTHDADGAGSAAAYTLMRELASVSEFSLVRTPNEPIRVSVNLALVDPFSRDGTQFFTINTMTANRIIPPGS